MRTLRSRLNRGLAYVLVLVFGGQWVLGSLAIQRVTEDQMATRLEHDGDALLAALAFDGNGALQLDATRLGPIYAQPLSGHYYVVHADGRIVSVSGSQTDGEMSARPPAAGEQRRYHAGGPAGKPLLILSRGFTVQGRTVGITVGEDLTDMSAEIMMLSFAYLGLILPVLLAAILMQTVDVRRALRPLSGLQRQLRAVQRGELDRIQGEVPGEIRPLVDEINRLLVLVERRLQQSRTAVGNLAHALKTPLAILFRIAHDPKSTLSPELQRDLQAQTAVIHDRIERELKRARLAGSGGRGANVNLRAELTVLAAVLRSVYRDKALSLDFHAADVTLPYDREDVLELLGNLTDNACKWAQEKVAVTVEENDGLWLTVADDGPGCAPEDMERLGHRGLRLDESKNGHGLGLAIAQDIVDFYGGTLDFDRDPALGGLRVRVHLPGR